MDTRRMQGSSLDPRTPAAELGTETVPLDLVELFELRSSVAIRGRWGVASVVPALVLLGIVTIIATFAIATSSGWSIVMNFQA